MKLFSFLQHPSLVLLINVLILFPLRLGLSNMFFVKTFRARQRQLVSIRLSNVDMMCEPRFWEALFRSSYAVLLTLHQENSYFPSKTTNSWEWGCSLWYYKHSASSYKSRRHIPGTDLIYRPDFLFETITQLIAH